MNLLLSTAEELCLEMHRADLYYCVERLAKAAADSFILIDELKKSLREQIHLFLLDARKLKMSQVSGFYFIGNRPQD